MLELWCFPLPGLPKLLCSATNLVTLRVWDIPRSGLISPEAMVTCLSALTKLENLVLGSRFQKPRYREENPSPPPPRPRSVFPALTDFGFKGYAAYLEDLVAGIDAPRLNDLSITFISPSVLHTPEIVQFISRTPNFSAPEKACIIFHESFVSVMLPSRIFGCREPHVNISYRNSHWPYSSLMEVCALPMPSLSTVSTRIKFRNWTGKTKSRIPCGGGFYVHLLRWRISTYPKDWGLASPRLTRPRRGRSDRNVTCPTELFFRRATAIYTGTCPGRCRKVRCGATGLQPPYSGLSLGQRVGHLVGGR
jgi:hypothetical protein